MSGDHIGAARFAIANLVHQYSDAVVRRDAIRWAATWHTEATWVLPGGRVSSGKIAIVEQWVAAMDRFDAVFQVVHNGEVTFPSDDQPAEQASGSWYVHEHFRKRTGDVGILLARYDDEYQRVEDQWLFRSRCLVVSYQGLPDLSGPFPKPEGSSQ
jgi:SnoaL-like domain